MRKRLCFIVLALLAVFSARAQNDTVVFSASGGFYEEVFALELNHIFPQYHIRYTTNGNRPTAQSQLYTEPLVMDSSLYSKSDIYTIVDCPEDLFYLPDSVQHCIVIRAAVFDENDSCVSRVNTNSYFIRALGCDTHELPAISICADSLDLFDYEYGIMVPGIWFDTLDSLWTGNYYQYGDEWERPMNVEFYELDNQGINQQAGLRTHGGNGRRFQQKGLKMYARQEYGKKRFKHRFFEMTPINSFKHLTLKPMCSSWTSAGFQDHLCNYIAHNGLDVESLASRPVVLFLNGEYWGIYFMHEKPDERYLEDHLDVDINACDIMGNWVDVVDHGDGTDFMEMMAWLETADLTDSVDFDHLNSQIDISSFIDYQILELFIANVDWPTNNMRCWRERNGKWRWFFFDGDAALYATSFDVFANATYDGDEQWPASRISTLMFRRLLENESFVSRFEERFLELLASRFQASEIMPEYARIVDQLRPEIPSQIARFSYPSDMISWGEGLWYMNWFIEHRAEDLAEMLADFISVSEHILLTNNVICYPNPSSGEIHIQWLTEGKADEIAIYDLLGRKVFAQSLPIGGFDEISINPNLSAGLYVLKMGSHTEKIIRY